MVEQIDWHRLNVLLHPDHRQTRIFLDDKPLHGVQEIVISQRIGELPVVRLEINGEIKVWHIVED